MSRLKTYQTQSWFGRSSAIGLLALSSLTIGPPSAWAQAQAPLDRVRSIGLDTVIVGRVTTFFAREDSTYAKDLATLTEAAAAYFEAEFTSAFSLHLAVLRPRSWFDPYESSVAAPYGLPWGWIPDSLIGVPGSLGEGVLILGPDEQADRQRVRFVMLHEYGHLAAKRYLHPRGDQLYSPVKWFEEMVATYFAYAFVYQLEGEWARSGRQEWVDIVRAGAPASATLDWRFMGRLPPEQFGQTYAWYQNLLNVRVADLYSEHGVTFLHELRDRLPWTTSEVWTTEMLLPMLDSIAPGFQAWADKLQQGEYITR